MFFESELAMRVHLDGVYGPLSCFEEWKKFSDDNVSRLS